MTYNRDHFFRVVRTNLGALKQEQVDGFNKILEYKEQKYPNMSDNELAYVLASVWHETAHTMQPITERGSKAYLTGKKYWPYIGRGLIQITWEENYRKYGIHNTPEKALEWDTALHILFDGMTKGVYTGKKLSDYFGPGKEDPHGARRIVNGLDRAVDIKKLYHVFQSALSRGSEAPQKPVEDVPATPVPQKPKSLLVSLLELLRSLFK